MEALTNVNQFGVCELNEDEMMEVDGGGWGEVLGGAALVVAAVGLTVATGGIGTIGVATVIGAGSSAEIAVAAVACAASAIGGAAIGSGINDALDN